MTKAAEKTTEPTIKTVEVDGIEVDVFWSSGILTGSQTATYHFSVLRKLVCSLRQGHWHGLSAATVGL